MEDLSNLKETVATLVDTDTGKSVATIVTEKVAELLIPENADEGLDTLQEIADWIQDHPGDAAEMNSNITILQGQVANLQDLLNGDENEDGLAARVSTLETTMGTFTPVEAKYLDVGSAITYLDNSITSIESDVHTLNERLK